MFCLFGDTLSFMTFSSFSSAVLLLHNQTRSICATAFTFFERGDLERTRHLLATWQDSRWRRKFARSFSSKSFHICAKKPQDIWVDRTFSKSKGKFLMEIVLLSKYSWKCNRFSIVIVNICETRNEWVNDLSRVIVWCHWWAWIEVMYKDGQTFCLGLFISLLHKIGSCSTLYFLCCYAITWVVWKQTVLCIMPIVMRISIL